MFYPFDVHDLARLKYEEDLQRAESRYLLREAGIGFNRSRVRTRLGALLLALGTALARPAAPLRDGSPAQGPVALAPAPARQPGSVRPAE